MRIKKLFPNQIITLNDFPVHQEQVLKIFFRVFQKKCAKAIPPCPVMHQDLVTPFFSRGIKKVFTEYVQRNPQPEYFLLDGSHRTTAATLARSKIEVMIFRNNKDIREAQRLVQRGELFSLTVGDTIKENATILRNHFGKKKYFQTVEQKTQKMVKEKVIPQYMVDYYRRNKK